MSRKLLIVVLLILLPALTACRRGDQGAIPTAVAPADTPTALPPTPVEYGTNTATPTPLPPTLTPTSPPPTATPLPTNTVPPPPTTTVPAVPTATPIPSATPAPSATATPSPTFVPGPPPGGTARIVFGPGATSAVVQGTLVAGGDSDTWVLRVNAGQVIAVQTLSTVPGTVIVSLLDPNGDMLATNPDLVGVSAAAPVTGDYQINLATADGAPTVSYTTQVFVPPAQTTPPLRLIPAPGTDSVNLPDTLIAGGDLNQYVIALQAGQSLTVSVFASVPAVTNIYIRDTNGRLITAGTDMSGAFATATTTGDYFIDISSAPGAPLVTYTLTVTAPPVAPPPEPVRIEFGPGQISAAFDGQIVAGGLIPQYTIAVRAGQTLITNLNDNPPGSVAVSIYDRNGALLNFGRGPTSLATVATEMADYNILLSADNTPASYSLEVVVPPLPGGDATRIVFPTGATSTVVGGELPFGGATQTWIVGGQGGQTLTVSVATATPGWLRLYVYNSAAQIIGMGTDNSGVSAPLATTGDYYIVVVSDPAIGPVSYSLAVEMR